MANIFTSNTLSGSYADDYNADDNYHQILFNSGRALQSRELTQMQTLIYEEMGRLGRNIFKEGAVVSGGGCSINNAYHFVKIASTNQGGSFGDIPRGTILKNTATNVSAQVIQAIPAHGTQTFDTLFVEYINGGNALATSSITTFGDNETLVQQFATTSAYELVTETPGATGYGAKFTVAEGDFFALGRFVHTQEQSIILSSYTSDNINATVGFKVVQQVVTVTDTDTLYDNANGIVNTASPGADRLQIKLELTTKDLVDANDTFVYLAEVENSSISEQLQSSDAYAKIEELLALRTKEESGDYVVEPFIVHVSDNDNGVDENLELNISEGTAYVNGYRVENQSPVTLSLPRPVETETVANDVIGVNYGNYFVCTTNRGLPNLDHARVDLWNATGYGGSGTDIGTCRIRAVEPYGTKFKVYVYDVKVFANESLAEVKSIGTATSDYFDVELLTGGAAVLNETTNNNTALFNAPFSRVESLSDIILSKQVRQAKTASTNTVTLDQLPSGQSYVDSSLWIVSLGSAVFEAPSTYTISITNGGRDAAISSLASASGAYEVLAYVQKTGAIRTKTLTSATAILPSVTDSSGRTIFDMQVPDIYSVDSVRQSSSSGFDLSGAVVLDDGQRDNFYADGTLTLKDGHAVPAGDIYVAYKYFARGSGDFFAPSSYNVPYKDIPIHTSITGNTVDLRDVVDFRPDRNGIDSAVTNINALPRVGTNITANIDYYLPRADKVIITPEGEIQVLMGQQAREPQFKETPMHSMELYKIVLNGNTINEDDLVIVPTAQQRGYTMKDIGDIDRKLDALEESTQLSIAELEARMDNVLDSAGVLRIISGMQVDEHADQTNAEVESPDYKAAIDPENRLVRPSFDEGNMRLIFDATASSGVVKKGDNVYLAHTEANWVDQSLASRTVKINPFGLVDNVGTLKLSPSTDEWKESIQNAAKSLAGAGRLFGKQAFLWNNWQWNWQGRTAKENTEIAKLSQTLRTGSGRSKAFALRTLKTKYGINDSGIVRRIIAGETLRNVVGEKTIDVAFVPWIRSRKIYFKAQGLTPNTKFTPFFDGTDVSVWCKSESSFLQWSDRADEIGNKLTHSAVLGHPDGTSELIADANGEVIGSFFIPNLTPKYEVATTKYRGRYSKYYLRFRSGAREFKLLDINVNDWAGANSKAFAHYTVKGLLPWTWYNPLSFTRGHSYLYPYNYRHRLYSAKEMKKVLDSIPASSVSIIDPRLSGLYSPDGATLNAAALQTLANNQDMSKVLSDYINVNQAQFASVLGTKAISTPMNPLAQTFKVNNEFGVTLTKVELFFKSKPANVSLPVSIHIRPVENGKPSYSTMVPDSQVFVNRANVIVSELSSQLVTIQGNGTSFVFDEPVYLAPGQDYAIVVTSQSTEYELFSARTSESVINTTGRFNSTQTPGYLFLPQNGKNWEKSLNEDLMFKVTRAVFGSGGGANGSLILKNAVVPSKLLEENPIQTVNSSANIYVRHVNHGLRAGDGANIDSATATGGFTAEQLSGSHQVIDVDMYGYRFEISPSNPVTATSTATGGGERVLSQGNINFSVVNPIIESIIPNSTSIDVSGKFTTGRSISGTETRFAQDANFTRITPKTNTDLAATYTLYNQFEVDSDRTGEGVATFTSSTFFKVDMKSANDYVSPIIDLQRSSLVTVNNLIDDPSVTPHIYNVANTASSGASSSSAHIMKPVVLESPAIGIEISADLSIPPTGSVLVYYRVGTSDQNLSELSWILQPEFNIIVKDGQSRRVKFLAGGVAGTLNPFTQAQTKIITTGTNPATPATIGSVVVKWLAS